MLDLARQIKTGHEAGACTGGDQSLITVSDRGKVIAQFIFHSCSPSGFSAEDQAAMDKANALVKAMGEPFDWKSLP